VVDQKKKLTRLAVAIHGQLANPSTGFSQTWLPAATWDHCNSLMDRIGRAHERGWHFAAGRLQRDLQFGLNRLEQELANVRNSLETVTGHVVLATVGDLYRDFIWLQQEFDDVSWDLHRQTLSVTTEPIVLEEVSLGRFEIRLDWEDLTTPSPYSIIAVDANPAASDESVTHPHVQTEKLCEGDAHLPICRALADGRFADFFVVVSRTLHTYNSSSPFVDLDRWCGVTCEDCGSSVGEDDYWVCESCSSRLCDDCRVSCEGCSDAFCSQCVTTCECCEVDHCNGCFATCAACQERVCPNCLEDNGKCRSCYAKECEQQCEEETDGAKDASPAHTAVQPLRVGEAAVSA